MSHFDHPEYKSLEKLWDRTGVQSAALAIKFRSGKVVFLGDPESGQELWTQAVKNKKRKTVEFLPKVNSQN